MCIVWTFVFGFYHKVGPPFLLQSVQGGLYDLFDTPSFTQWVQFLNKSKVEWYRVYLIVSIPHFVCDSVGLGYQYSEIYIEKQSNPLFRYLRGILLPYLSIKLHVCDYFSCPFPCEYLSKNCFHSLITGYTPGRFLVKFSKQNFCCIYSMQYLDSMIIFEPTAFKLSFIFIELITNYSN